MARVTGRRGRSRTPKTINISKIPRPISRSLRNQGFGAGMPKTRTATLRWCFERNLVATGGFIQKYRVGANDPYQPDHPLQGASTHQPLAWDQWAAQYNHYVVKGSKISAKLVPKGGATANSSPLVFGVYLSASLDDSYVGWETFHESKKGTMIVTPPNGGSKPLTVVSKFSAKNFFNVTDIKDNFSRLGNRTDMSPAEGAYYIIWYQTLANVEYETYLLLTVDYIIEFSEPKDQNPS